MISTSRVVSAWRLPLCLPVTSTNTADPAMHEQPQPHTSSEMYRQAYRRRTGQTDRQTNRQTDRLMDRTDRQADRQVHWYLHKQMHRQLNTLSGRKSENSLLKGRVAYRDDPCTNAAWAIKAKCVLHGQGVTEIGSAYLTQFEHVTLSSIDHSVQLVNLCYLLVYCCLLLLEHHSLPAQCISVTVFNR